MGHPGRSYERGGYEKKETGMFKTKFWIMLQYSAAEQHYRPGMIKLALSMSVARAIQHRQGKTSILTIKDRSQSNYQGRKKKKGKQRKKKRSSATLNTTYL